MALMLWHYVYPQLGTERRTLSGKYVPLGIHTHAKWLRERQRLLSVHNKEDIDPKMPRQEGKQRPALLGNFCLLFGSIQMQFWRFLTPALYTHRSKFAG